MLAIAKKLYVFQGVNEEDFDSALVHLQNSVKAFEGSKEEQTVSKLIEAYQALPDHDKSLSIGADIIESLLQLKAYHQAIDIAEQIERTIVMKDNETKCDYFNMLRVYANLAEAHSEAHHLGMARRYYHKALDHIYESSQEPDIEMINLLLHRLEQVH